MLEIILNEEEGDEYHVLMKQWLAFMQALDFGLFDVYTGEWNPYSMEALHRNHIDDRYTLLLGDSELVC